MVNVSLCLSTFWTLDEMSGQINSPLNLTPALIGERDCCVSELFLPVKREKYLSPLEYAAECNNNGLQSVEYTVIRNSQNVILKVTYAMDSVHYIGIVLCTSY